MTPRVTLAAVILAGITAGATVTPFFYLATIIVFVVLAQGFRRAADQDGPDAIDEWSVFSPAVARRIEESLITLPQGDAQRSLRAIAVSGRSLLATVDRTLDAEHERTTREHVDSLVGACCGAALELSRLDDALGANSTAQSAARERLAASRGVLQMRLADASEALRQLYAAGVASGSTASDRVAELTAELNQDAAARHAALTELSQLLGAEGAKPRR